jgi:hypothetical protein
MGKEEAFQTGAKTKFLIPSRDTDRDHGCFFTGKENFWDFFKLFLIIPSTKRQIEGDQNKKDGDKDHV